MTRLAIPAGTSGVDSGQRNNNSARGIGGTFQPSAAASTTVTDADILAGSTVVFGPANGPAGILTGTKHCFIATADVTAGQFIFTVSATGAGAPAGTETFWYIAT